MSTHTKWKLLAILFVALTVVSVVSWQEFILAPTRSMTATTTARSTYVTHTQVTTEEYSAVLGSLKDVKFAEYAAAHRLCMEDNRLTELEVTFLSDPEQYGPELINSYIEEAELSTTYYELGAELRKIPEVKSALNKTEITILESVEDIVYSVLNSQDLLVAGNLERILNEGIKEIRKYSAPLQALLWHYVDEEPSKSNPLASRFDPNWWIWKFVRPIWRYSSMSRNYTTDRWMSFEQVVDRLNSPDLISVYMEDQMPWGGAAESPKNRYWWKTPQETFADKRGFCYDLAAFALYCLTSNGYSTAKILFVRWGELGRNTTGRAHAVCVYEVRGGTYAIDNGRRTGPFSALDDVMSSASDGRRVLAYRFFYYGSIPYHKAYGEIYNSIA